MLAVATDGHERTVAALRTSRDRSDSVRANQILAGGVGALLLLTVGAIAFATLRPSPPTPEAPAAKTASLLATAAAVATAATPELSSTPATPAAKPEPPASKPKPKRAPAPGHVPTIPDRMARVPSSTSQMLVFTGPKLGSNTGTLRIFERRIGGWVQVFSAAARCGNNGLTGGETRQQGTRTTPTGIWWIGSFVFGQHPQPPSGTRMPYRHITDNSWWSAEAATYNTWVESSSHVNGEHLAGVPIQYEYALSTGYNAPPNKTVIGRGTAIFLHIFDPPDYHGGFSAGCVAISRDDIVRVFRIVDPKKKPSFAIGTEAKGTPTSIWAY